MKAIIVATLTSLAVFLAAEGMVQTRPVEAARATQHASKCRNIQIGISPYTSQGAAGHIAIIYRIYNVSTQTCSLFGYPGVQLLNRHFSTLPTTVHRAPGNLIGPIPKHAVRLSPRGTAYFALGYSDVPVNNRPCSTAHYLMVFAPNDFLPVVTYAGGQGGIIACSGNINVSPVTGRPRFQ